jgi:hypothetical protein
VCSIIDKNGKIVSRDGESMQSSIRGIPGNSPAWNYKAFGMYVKIKSIFNKNK